MKQCKATISSIFTLENNFQNFKLILLSMCNNLCLKDIKKLGLDLRK
jgi:hypothetical protein